MIPIRCLSCGKPVSAYFDEYNKRLAAGEKSKDILDDLGLKESGLEKLIAASYRILGLKFVLKYIKFHIKISRIFLNQTIAKQIIKWYISLD